MSSDPVDFFTPGTSTFIGVAPGSDGRNHNVIRTTCNGCGYILSQSHIGCCGHGACGFGSFNHVCKEKP